MKYMRSRPWGPRGPWFSNRVGARRRWRRSDELDCAITGEMTDGYGDELVLTVTAATEKALADDVLLLIASQWPLPERMLAAADSDHVVTGAPRQPAAEPIPERLDRTAEEVVAAHMLVRPGDDDVTASRQSA